MGLNLGKGTTWIICLAEFLDIHRLENIVRRHSDYVSYPIKVGGKQANNTSALWTRPRNEITAEQYDEFIHIDT